MGKPFIPDNYAALLLLEAIRLEIAFLSPATGKLSSLKDKNIPREDIMVYYGGEYQTGNKSRFMQWMLYGAMAGAAISLLDRNTRQSLMQSGRNAARGIQTAVKHPNSMLNQVREATSTLRTTIQQVTDDVAFIAEQINEVKDITPQMAAVVRETADAFTGEGHPQVHH
ncbi:hypothetical protein [Peribacillus saganii]|uniref:hypothetical protein n=1 Tax=Peribacillus saganii TaxID=2303992 RepID=UPI00115E25A6|nr:hypothetical protein [Peribacillus saganii]